MKVTFSLLALASTALSFPLSLNLFPRAGTTTGYTSGNSANDVTNGVCAPLTVIFARGTGESGNIGSVVGPKMFAALSSSLSKKVALQGVNYPADNAGNANLGASGGPNMASLAQQALKQCPSTKIALSGYSQGGLVTHYAVQNAGLSASSVSAVALFGDPENGRSVGSVPASKVKEYCATGDGICNGSFGISAAHLSYGNNAADAAAFIIKTSGVSA